MQMPGYVLVGAIFSFLPSLGMAGNFEPVVLPAIEHQTALLTVIDAEGVAHTYSPAQLETFPTYSLTTTTPWRDEAAEFEGILLSDLLAAHDIQDVATIEVVAENDFISVFDAEVWQTGAFLIATRVNGDAHSRRLRGPIQFVVDSGTYQSATQINESHLVWMAATIRPADVPN